MSFKVQEVVDGNIIRVSPRWIWKAISGELVKIVGYQAPTASSRDYIIWKLTTLLDNAEIELKNPQEISNATIYCEVYLNDVDISEYFQELNV